MRYSKFVVIEQSHDPHPYNTIIYSTSFVKHILLLRIIFFKSFHNQFSIRSTKAKSTPRLTSMQHNYLFHFLRSSTSIKSFHNHIPNDKKFLSPWSQPTIPIRSCNETIGSIGAIDWSANEGHANASLELALEPRIDVSSSLVHHERGWWKKTDGRPVFNRCTQLHRLHPRVSQLISRYRPTDKSRGPGDD